MKRCKPISIGELWDDFKRRNPQVALKIAQGSVGRYWEEIVGPGVAAMTRSVELRGGVLHLSVTSPIVRQEISMRRHQLRDQMNKKAQIPIVKEIIVR